MLDFSLFHVDELSMRLLWATGLGAMLGIEREWTQKAAGLRTHMLVSLGAAVFTVVSISDLPLLWSQPLQEGVMITINRDPARIAAQIVTGLGFIGGGALLRHGTSVHGLTTAANLWMAGSLGMLAGAGYYGLSFIAAMLTILVLFPVGTLERLIFKKHRKHWNRLRIKLTVEDKDLDTIQEWMEDLYPHEILRLKAVPGLEGETTILTYILDASRFKKPNIHSLTQTVQAKEGVVASTIQLFRDEEGSRHPNE